MIKTCIRLKIPKKKILSYYAKEFDYIGCESRFGYSLRDINLAKICAENFGKISGNEDEGSFFSRCIGFQGGRVANHGNISEFCISNNQLSSSPSSSSLLLNDAHDDVNNDDKEKLIELNYFGVHNPNPSLVTDIHQFCPEYQSLLDIS
jgi:hypothetical protein